MRRQTAIGLAAVGAVLALVAGASVVWPGLDAQRTPPKTTTAWVLQSDGLRYARVNTAIDELDTVRAVSNPSRIVQTQGASYMFTDSDAKVVRIDDAVPVDLDAEGLRDAASAPPGTEEVDTSGDFVAYRTDAGAISAGRLSSGQVTPLDPTGTRSSEGADGPAYTSDAIAVDATGELFSYSAAAGTVVRMDIDTGEVRGTDSVAADVSAPALTAAGDDWVLVDTASGDYWTVRRAGVSAGTSGVVALSRADADGDAVALRRPAEADFAVGRTRCFKEAHLELHLLAAADVDGVDDVVAAEFLGDGAGLVDGLLVGGGARQQDRAVGRGNVDAGVRQLPLKSRLQAIGVQRDLEVGGADHVALLVEQHDAGDAALRTEHHERLVRERPGIGQRRIANHDLREGGGRHDHLRHALGNRERLA